MTAIQIDNLFKRYNLGIQTSYQTLRETLSNWIRQTMSKNFRGYSSKECDQPNTNTIWALKNVSLEIRQGEVVGIIGSNGAGKSTLLKVLARITDPTEGRVELRGRVGSLLEVGTGFHPELTGQENIYLNGAINGMSRNEVTTRFDEIVAFAECEKFLQTPVKRYSSGMYMRLAFAVAAHLDAELLLVDEVLSVGDLKFQKKCITKMQEVANQQGRTVLFVSHNLNAVASLCSRGIVFQSGEVSYDGVAQKAVSTYIGMVSEQTRRGILQIHESEASPISVEMIQTLDESGAVCAEVPRSKPICIQIQGSVRQKRDDYIIAVDVKNMEDTLLFRTHSFEQSESYNILNENGNYILHCIIPADLLPAGTYRLGIIVAIAGKKEIQNIYPALELDVIQDRLLGEQFSGTRGIFTPPCVWQKVYNAQ